MERWMPSSYAPVVLTCASPEVERIAHKNTLGFADLLNAYANISEANVTIRSVSQQLHQEDFQIRFIPSSQFATPSPQDATKLLSESIAKLQPHKAVDLNLPSVKSVDDVPNLLHALDAQDASSDAVLPWYAEFRRTLLASFRCEEYSMMDQPAAIVIAVASTESNPRYALSELNSPHNLPPAFGQGLYDPNIPKYYIVVHDVGETRGTEIDGWQILQDLELDPSSSTVLSINSLPPEEATANNSGLWYSFSSPRPTIRFFSEPQYEVRTDHAGGLLSSQDLQALEKLSTNISLRIVLPYLETRLHQLNDVVSATKKGVKNVFKSWWRKPRDTMTSGSDQGKTTTYRYDTIEAQTRLLADIAFSLHDYDLALQTYRLVREDYKADKSLLHFADTNHMIALCLLQLRGSPMQMTHSLDAAINAYQKANAPPRHTVRSSLLAGEVFHKLSHSGLLTDYMDNASAALMRGSTAEQGICCAVLTERAAYCDLQARIPKFRKAGFRLVLAGYIYLSLGLQAHGARCYAIARSVYYSSGWILIEDHIHSTLVSKAQRLSDPLVPISLFLSLLTSGRNSASHQEILLQEFGALVKDFLVESHDSIQSFSTGPALSSTIRSGRKRLLVKDMDMPELDDQSTFVYAVRNASKTNEGVDLDEEWREMMRVFERQNEVDKYAHSRESSSGNKWLETPPLLKTRLRSIKAHQPPEYAVDEAIYVEFVVKNALMCAVQVQEMQLIGHFDGTRLEELSSDVIQVQQVDLLLPPCSEERVQLSILPRASGLLKLEGVSWSICDGDVVGEHLFDIPGPLLQDTRAHKESRARAENPKLMARIVGDMPWLGVSLEMEPQILMEGEVFETQVELSNGGKTLLSGLELCVDGNVKAAVYVDEEQVGYIGSNGQVVDLRNVQLAPGDRKQVRLYLKPQAGEYPIRMVFRYTDVYGKVYRHVRLKYDILVSPSMDISYSIRPSRCQAGEYLFALHVVNRKEYASALQLDQVLWVSRQWTLERFGTHVDDAKSAIYLDSWEASTLYFILRSKEHQESWISLSEDEQRMYPWHQFLRLDIATKLLEHQPQSSVGGMRSIQSVRRDNKAMQPTVQEEYPQPMSSEALMSMTDLDAHLSLMWTAQAADGSWVHGQSNLPFVYIRDECPVAVSLHYEPCIEMDTTSVAQAHVVVTIANTSPLSSSPVDLTVEMLPPKAMPKVTPSFIWVGPTKKHITELAPRDHISFQVHACFFQSGMYDLNHLRLTLQDETYMFMNVTYPIQVVAPTAMTA